MIPLNAPSITDLERKYVLDALDSGWITTGEYVRRFEETFAEWLGLSHAITCSSGTAALWLALTALEREALPVAVPAYTCDSVANAATLVTGQSPLILDVDPLTWGLAVGPLREMIERGVRLHSVILVHTYGVPAVDTDPILSLCRSYGIPVIEDCSEAHGASVAGMLMGRHGQLAVFSCRGEKMIAAGQMGVVATEDAGLAERVRYYSNNGLPSTKLRYWSTGVGLNLMTSNLLAALACAQLERLDELIARRRAVHATWRELLNGIDGLTFQGRHGEPVWWLTALRLSPAFTRLDPRDLGTALLERGIESRPGFYPLHWLPAHEDHAERPEAERLFRSLLILPSGPTITRLQQERVKGVLLHLAGREPKEHR